MKRLLIVNKLCEVEMKIKTLILFLLLSGVVIAQTKFVWEKDLPKDTTAKFYAQYNLDNHIVTTNRNGQDYVCYDFFVGMAVELWTSYQKECYADSTINRTEHFIDTVKENQWREKYPSVKKLWHYAKEINYYSHRQPTFEGFMTYLKREGEK